MLNREEFVERQVAFQFGRCAAGEQRSLTEIAAIEAKSRNSLFIFHNPADQTFFPEERGAGLRRESEFEWSYGPPGNNTKGFRNSELLSDTYALGLTSPIFADMQDAVYRQGAAFPVFQYNRFAGATNSILWPLRRVHRLGSKSFCALPDPTESKLTEKRPVVFWRGSLRGFSTFGRKPLSIKTAIHALRDGKMAKEEFLSHLHTVPRFIFVSHYFGMDGFDVGFTHFKGMAYFDDVPEIARYARPYANPDEQIRYKYLVSIEGNDVASSFGWQISSNSVVFREAYKWEVFFDCHLREWEHYVPLMACFTDVPTRIAWCEANPDACDAMRQRRHEVVRCLVDKELRIEALQCVVDRYNRFYQQWSDGRDRP